MTPRPRPLYFGPEDRPLFGWLHEPHSATARGLGVVICNPFGYEEICAHRSIKYLAETAAASGLPTMRFDYDGMGDSAGTGNDPDRLEAWIASVGLAADVLRDLTGVERLCFVGLRLGATLASLAAGGRSDVEALVALAPIVNAKAYLRELRALQSMMNRNKRTLQENTDGALEAAGFILTAEAQTALSGIDLNRVTEKPAPCVLLVDRTDAPGNDRWAEHLRSLGTVVEQRAFEGYVEMMLDAHESAVPQNTIDGSVEWLASLAPPQAASAHLSLAAGDARKEARVDPAVQETAVWFGEDSILFGVISSPASGVPTETILLLNSGAVSHCGPNRLYVTLARRWAALGYRVLRMDLSGLGDSATRPRAADNIVYSSHAAEDIRSALEFLRHRYGAQCFHSLGICSGAYHSLKAAVAGLPLASIIVINPLTFFWEQGVSPQFPEYQLAAEAARYSENLWRLQPWLKLLSGQVDLLALSQVLLGRLYSVARSRCRNLLSLFGLPLVEDLARELKTIANRPVDLAFVFAAADPGLELLRQQGGRAVPRLQARGQLDIRIVEDADHTFTDHGARQRLWEILVAKLGGPRPAP